MILLGMLAAMIAGQHFAWVWLLSLVLVLLGSSAFAYLLLHPFASAGWGRLGRSMTYFPSRLGKQHLKLGRKYGLSKSFSFSVVAMLAYGTQALVFSWFCHVLGTGISIADCVLIFVQATLFGAASMIPGGLGAMEAALVFQLVEHGVSDSSAMSLAISIRLVTLWFGMLLGVFSLLIVSAQEPRTKGLSSNAVP